MSAFILIASHGASDSEWVTMSYSSALWVTPPKMSNEHTKGKGERS